MIGTGDGAIGERAQRAPFIIQHHESLFLSLSLSLSLSLHLHLPLHLHLTPSFVATHQHQHQSPCTWSRWATGRTSARYAFFSPKKQKKPKEPYIHKNQRNSQMLNTEMLCRYRSRTLTPWRKSPSPRARYASFVSTRSPQRSNSYSIRTQTPHHQSSIINHQSSINNHRSSSSRCRRCGWSTRATDAPSSAGTPAWRGGSRYAPMRIPQ